MEDGNGYESEEIFTGGEETDFSNASDDDLMDIGRGVALGNNIRLAYSITCSSQS